jgi:hypothetical protein
LIIYLSIVALAFSIPDEVLKFVGRSMREKEALISKRFICDNESISVLAISWRELTISFLSIISTYNVVSVTFNKVRAAVPTK